MHPGTRRPGPEPSGPLVAAAAMVRTREDLAALLRELRRRHARSRRDSRLTYRELAARTGWSQTAIAEYFTARTLPPTDRLDALLEVLSATPAERRALATARDRVEEAGRRARTRPAAPPSSTAPITRPAAARPRAVPCRAARHRPPAPRQLPAAPRTFTGRARELAHLTTVLGETSQDGGALVVSGMAGIGKTWLAVHWAHRHADRFPDGQLYADLRGFDPTDRPPAPATVVRGFLAALGVRPAAIPAELQAQVGLYRSLVAGRRMLVLLDNARDTAQVTPLLPGGATCTVLITARRRLTGLIATHGARSLALDGLPGDEAHRLLARHLGRARLDAEPDAVAALLARCGGLPLALSIVAARATIDPRLSLTTLAAELNDDTRRLDALHAGEPQADLRAVLSWSGRVMPPDVVRAFGLLGIAPGPDIALAAAARLLDLPPAAARALLDELYHAHLVQMPASARYRMHDLLRLHATEQARDHLPPAERRAALRRLVGFYADTACSGALLLAPNHPAPLHGGAAPGRTAHPLPDMVAAMAWFDAERFNLLAAQRLARGQGWDTQVCRLAWALDPYHRRRGHIEDQAVAWHRAVTCARRLDDPAVRSQAHQMLGDAYAQLGKTGDAMRHLREALALAERAGDVAGQGEIHHSLGGTWERHGDDRRALDHARQALSIFQRLGHAFRQARALNGVGWLQARLGDYADARANCRAALALLRQDTADDRRIGESHTLDSLGYIAHGLGEYDQALGHYRHALAICRAQGHSFLEADVLSHIAETHVARRHLEQARDTWRQACELYTAQHRRTKAQHVRRRLSGLLVAERRLRRPDGEPPGTPPPAASPGAGDGHGRRGTAAG